MASSNIQYTQIKEITESGKSGKIICIGPLKIWIYEGVFNVNTTTTIYLPAGFNVILASSISCTQAGFSSPSTLAVAFPNTTTCNISNWNNAGAAMTGIVWAIGY